MHPLRLPRAPAAAPTSVVPVAALPLYPRLLGRSFAELDEPVRALHFTTGARRARGRAAVRRGAGLLARLVGWVLRLPPAAATTPMELQVRPGGGGETWDRRFGDGRLVTRQRALRGGLLAERIGPLELRARPAARDGALVLDAAGAALRLGPLALPLPGALAPRLTGRLWCGEDGRLRLRVQTTAPLCGLLLEYEATLED